MLTPAGCSTPPPATPCAPPPSSPAALLPPPSSVLTGGPPPSSPLLAPVLARAGAPRCLGFRDPPRLHLPNPPAEGIEVAPRLFAAAVALPRPRSAVAPPPPPLRPAPPRPGITPAAHSAHLWTGAEGRVLGGRRPLEVCRSWGPCSSLLHCARLSSDYSPSWYVAAVDISPASVRDSFVLICCDLILVPSCPGLFQIWSSGGSETLSICAAWASLSSTLST